MNNRLFTHFLAFSFACLVFSSTSCLRQINTNSDSATPSPTLAGIMDEPENAQLVKETDGASLSCKGQAYMKIKTPALTEQILRFLKLKTDNKVDIESSFPNENIYFIKLTDSQTMANLKKQLVFEQGLLGSKFVSFMPDFVITADQVNQLNRCAGNCDSPTIDWMKSIQMDRVWNGTIRGNPKILTAVLDSGINVNHPDLNDNIWKARTNHSFFVQGKQVNCLVGDWGYDTTTSSCQPPERSTHGTRVAGIIGGECDNGGIRGVNCNSKIISVNVLPYRTLDGAEGCVSDLIKGIYFVINLKKDLEVTEPENNLRVINCSLGIFSNEITAPEVQPLEIAMNDARSEGILFVAAAGNGKGTDIRKRFRHYPASFALNNMISVSSVEINDELRGDSSVGADIGAPGTAIVSTTGAHDYEVIEQTSAATPFVSGAAALILSKCEMSPDALKNLILKNTNQLQNRGGVDPLGKLNVCKALNDCMPKTSDRLNCDP